MISTRHITALLALLLLGTACSVTRHLPEGSFLVDEVKIKTDRETPARDRIPAADLERYIRQTPNKRLLGTDFYVWFYQQANPAKQNGWNKWKRRIGEEPVLLDKALTEQSARNLKVYMDTKGFFSSESSFKIDTNARRRRAKITYYTRQGLPYRIASIDYEFRDRHLAPILLPDTVNTLLHIGDRFDITVLDEERNRITAYLKERGYYNFTVNNIEYVADTLAEPRSVGVRMVIKQYLAGYDGLGQPIMEDNKVYRIDRVHIMPNYNPSRMRNDHTLLDRLDTLFHEGLEIVYEGRPNLRKKVLRHTVPLYPDSLYDSREVNRTYADLMALGYLKSARLSFTERPATAPAREALPSGAAGDSLRPREGRIDCNILCTPTLKQSFKIELEGSTTSSFYGLKATVGYQNRNIFRGAEALDVSFTTGLEFMKAPDAKRKRATEFGIAPSLTFPRFLLPWRVGRSKAFNQPRTKIELSVNFQDRPYYKRVLSSAGITYMWTNSRYSSFSLRPIDINVVDVSRLDEEFLNMEPDGSEDQGMVQNQYLRESFRTQFIGGLSFGYTYNNQRSNLGGNATNIRFNLETAGNLIDGVERLFWSRPPSGEREIFGLPYSQYVRADLSVSRKIMLGEKAAIVGRIYGGVAKAYGNSTAVPFDRQFYAGGSNGMRGWAPRTLGQGSVPDPDDSFPIQTGDIKLEANLELRFPIWGIVHGATFFDLGNIWYIEHSDNYSPDAVFHFDNFYRQLGFNTGLGLRFDVKFFVLRLDWGVQLHNPNRPAGERWIDTFRWKNTALNFGVGYPF